MQSWLVKLSEHLLLINSHGVSEWCIMNDFYLIDFLRKLLKVLIIDFKL